MERKANSTIHRFFFLQAVDQCTRVAEAGGPRRADRSAAVQSQAQVREEEALAVQAKVNQTQGNDPGRRRSVRPLDLGFVVLVFEAAPSFSVLQLPSARNHNGCRFVPLEQL